jgi:transposase
MTMPRKTRAKKTLSAIESLQAELAERRARVEACQRRHDEAVERSRRELEAARAGVDEYVAKIAEALGLPNPAHKLAKRLATMRLNKKIRKLAAAGRAIPEIAADLGVGVQVVEDVLRTGGDDGGEGDDEGSGPGDGEAGTPGSSERPLRLPPESGQKGWKRERVRALFLEGKVPSEIADDMDISADSVRTHIAMLRRDGRLPPRGGPSAPAPRAEAPGEPASGGEDEGGEGDGIDDLREEAARQQGGQRSRQVRLATTAEQARGEEDDHEHVAAVDRMGDGVTVPDDTGHQHKIHRFVVGGAAGHRHGLLAKEPPASAD